MLASLRRAADRLLSGALLLVALAVAAVFLVPKLLGLDVYAITTGSMAGTVDPGGLVVSERVPAADLRVGDVITYLPPAGSGVSHLVTHRITGIEPDADGTTSYTTKGDANPADDPWTFTLLSGEQPRMVFTAPLLGRPVLWLADRDTRMLAIGVPAGVIALMSLVELGRALRRPADEPAQSEAPAYIDLTDVGTTRPTPVPASV